MVNMFEDMRTGAFNYDYMLGAFTAAIWIRCIILLQLTESFGPLIVMIANMIVIVLKFLVLYLLGVLTFACVALLTLSELPAYEDLFESFRTFVNASLGSYDLYMYDGFSNWKKYYGIGLHLAVLFYNMLIVINLLIAIMSDEYGRLQEVRTGLYWGTVIREMPKYKYNKHYGSLTMVPFVLSWLNIFTIPAFFCVKDRQTLE